MSLTLFFVPGLIFNSRLFESSTNYYLNNFDLKEPTSYKCQKWTKSHTNKTNADIYIYLYLYKHHPVANDVHKQIHEHTRVYRKIKANTRKHLTNDYTTSRNTWMFGKCLCFAQSGYHHLIPRERSCQNHRANLQDDK